MNQKKIQNSAQITFGVTLLMIIDFTYPMKTKKTIRGGDYLPLKNYKQYTIFNQLIQKTVLHLKN